MSKVYINYGKEHTSSEVVYWHTLMMGSSSNKNIRLFKDLRYVFVLIIHNLYEYKVSE